MNALGELSIKVAEPAEPSMCISSATLNNEGSGGTAPLPERLKVAGELLAELTTLSVALSVSRTVGE